MPHEIGLRIQGDKLPGEYAALARLAEGYGIDVLSVYADLFYQPAIGPLLEMAAATDGCGSGQQGSTRIRCTPTRSPARSPSSTWHLRGSRLSRHGPRDMA